MPDMPRRVFLHVGAPKSGTTYLQDRWRRNAASLVEQGLTYVPSASGTHFLPALDLIDRRWGGERERARGAWEGFVRKADQIDGNVLVSHEILAAARTEQVARALDAFRDDEVHLLYTARDLARQVPAEWQENVKHRAKKTFRGFLHEIVAAPRTDSDVWFWRVQALPDVLTRWGSGLPPERIHIVTVPQAGAPAETLWYRVCSVVGLDPAREYADSDLVNASIGISEATVIRRLNARLGPRKLPRDQYVELVRGLVVRDTFGARRSGPRAGVPVGLQPFFDAVAQEWRDWVEASGVQVVGDLDELRPRWPAPEDPSWSDRPRQGDVATAAIDALAAVLLEAARREAAPPAPVTAPVARVKRLTRRILGP
jgi:hypothetical protein